MANQGNVGKMKLSWLRPKWPDSKLSALYSTPFGVEVIFLKGSNIGA